MMRALSIIQQKKLSYHVVGWLTFIAYEISFVGLIRGLRMDASIWGGYVLPYIINICFFYFHALVVLETSAGKIRRLPLLFFFLTVVELIVYLLLMRTIDWAFGHGRAASILSLFSDHLAFIQQLWRGIYFLIFSTAYWFIRRYFRNEKRLKETETRILLQQQEKKELELRLITTQNAFLQSQINPHLLFNSLNFIHSEVQQISAKASDAIIILSDMMRYSLSETKTDGKVLLEKEIEQIGNLIRMNQFRFQNNLHLKICADDSLDKEIRIMPLLLLPFVENMFKYADLTDAGAPGRISIRVNGDQLCFETFNKKRNAKTFHTQGIGIDNVKKRLNAYYPDKFLLNIDNTESTFRVELIITL